MFKKNSWPDELNESKIFSFFAPRSQTLDLEYYSNNHGYTMDYSSSPWCAPRADAMNYPMGNYVATEYPRVKVMVPV